MMSSAISSLLKPFSSIRRILLRGGGLRSADFYLLLGTLVGAAMVQAVSPLALRQAVNAATKQSLFGISEFLVAYVALIAVGRISSALTFSLFAAVSGNLRLRLSKLAYSAALLDRTTIDESQDGYASFKIIEEGLNGVRGVLSGYVFGVIPPILQTLGAIIVVTLLGKAWLCPVLVGYAGAYYFVARSGYESQTHLQRELVKHERALSTRAAEWFSNIETVKASGSSTFLYKRLSSDFERNESIWREMYKSRRSTRVKVGLLTATGMALLFAFVLITPDKVITHPGDIVLISSYGLQLISPLNSAGSATQAISAGMVHVSELLPWLGEWAPPISPQPDYSSVPIMISDVTVRRKDRIALDCPALIIDPCSTTFIVGPNGSGKSTLLKVIAGLINPSSGSISVFGSSSLSYSEAELASLVYYVPQRTHIFSGSILDNVCMGNMDISRDSLALAAEVVAIGRLLEQSRGGWNRDVQHYGAALSGGERQRIAIARALLHNPRVLLLDESASAMDSASEAGIYQAIRQNYPDITLIIVSHNRVDMSFADRVIVLEEARMVFSGPAALAAGSDDPRVRKWFYSTIT